MVVENNKFINNTATMGGLIYSGYAFTSKNNYYGGNHANDEYLSTRSDSAYYGVIYAQNNGDYTFENDIFENNHAYESGVIGWGVTSYSASQTRNYNFNNCKFINNSAVEAGVSKLKSGSFANCEFINNSADYGGVFVLLPFVADSKTLELINVTFDGNTAKNNGNDIYLSTYNRASATNVYAIDLTLNFNDLNTSSLVDDLTVNVSAPYAAQVGGSTVYFLLDGNKIGTSEIINGVATLNYAGFEDGQYNLSGYMDYQNANVIVNNATVNVKLEGILDNVTYWVAVNGSDENGNGSEANPFKSISYAVGQATKNCRNITINVAEGTYAGDLNTGLTLSSLNDIVIKGAGIGKTVIDGENATTLAKITSGNKLVEFSDLTVKNMLPDNRVSKTIDAKVPLTIEEGANLLLNNVEMADNHGGEAIIINNGNLAIENSQFRRNGFSTVGLISGGNVTIDNSVFEDSYAQSRFMTADNLVINNSEIKNIYTISDSEFAYSLSLDLINENSYSQGNVVIENTIISNDGSEKALNDLGVTSDGKFVNPAFAINGNLNMTNSSMINNYNGTIYTDAQVASIAELSVLGYAYVVPRDVNVYNSSFINFHYLWTATTNQVHNFAFDGCVFENLEYIAWIRTNVPDSNYNITNSVFLNSSTVINQQHYSTMPTPQHINFNNNYWGDNEQPTIYFMGQAAPKSEVYQPDTWIILTSEDEKSVIKNLTDGENITAYEGNAPIRTDYADNQGALDYAVVFGPVGYLFTTDDDKNVIFDPEDAMYPFVAADPLNYRDYAFINIKKVNGSGAIFAILTDVMGNPIPNATIVFNVSDVQYNTTTDDNGSFVALAGNGLITLVFEGNDIYFDTSKSITLENVAPVKTQTSIETIIDGNLAVSGILVDATGAPVANVTISYIINGTQTNITTDDKGAFTIQGINGETVDITFEGDAIYQATKTSVTLDNIATSKTAVVIEVANSTLTSYSIDKGACELGTEWFVATLKDINGNILANTTVQFVFDGEINNLTTDENGTVKFQLNKRLSQTYTGTFIFLGDDKYEAAMSMVTATVSKKPITIKASAKTFKAKAKSKKYTVTLSTIVGSSADGKTVTLKINGKKYTAKTNAKGQATFNLKLTKKGKYSASISFAIEKGYKGASKSVKITVK